MPRESPIDTWFSTDPLVQYSLIPTDIDPWFGLNPSGEPVDMEEGWKRYVRVYFPKSREALREGYDFFVFPDGYLEPFTGTQIADMRYAIEMGTGSLVTFGGDLADRNQKSFPKWASSVLGDTLPNILSDQMEKVGGVFYVTVTKDDPPVLSMFLPLGLEKWVGGVGFSHLFPKVGAEVWGKVKSDRLAPGDPDNWLVSWVYGQGVSWAVADDLDHLWWSALFYPADHNNEYAEDVFLNIVYYSIGWDLPQDIPLVHSVRTGYATYDQHKVLLYALLEFVDRFGANTFSLESEISDAEDLKETSFGHYRQQEYDKAKEAIEGAIESIDAVNSNAVELKARALAWVYVTEWAAVSGTLIVSGLLVHSLLVERRLYRDVGYTRRIARD